MLRSVRHATGLGRFCRRQLGARDRRSRLHPAQLHPLRGRRVVPRRSDRGDQQAVGRGHGPLRAGGGRRRRAGHGHQGRLDDHVARGGLHRQAPREDRGPSDRAPPQARADAQRRHPHGGSGVPRQRLRGRPRGRRLLHQLPQDPQRRRVRRLHRRDARLPPLAHHHGPARRLRPRPHHRRLPPRRALRRRPPDRREDEGQ